ncbi:MAG: hypothetical protein IJ784_02655 [Ruminiclostridium sp.]|nr:hypothetical protein [Ruminiclostridium sp.]
MSGKGEKMYDAVTGIREDNIEQAADYKFRKSPARFAKPLGIAAGICLAGGAAALVMTLSGTGTIRTKPAEIPAGTLATFPTYRRTIPEGAETVPAGTLATIPTYRTTIPEGLETVPPDGGHAAGTAETTVPAGGSRTAETTADTNKATGDIAPGDVPAYGAGTGTSAPQNVITESDESGNDFAIPDWDGDEIPGGGDWDDANPGGGGFFMMRSYTPPVFPLTADGDTAGITAEREVTFDLSGTPVPGDLKEWSGNIDEVGAYTLYDSYTLTNTTDEDRTLTLMYPFKSSMGDLLSNPDDWDSATINEAIPSFIPAVKVNGETAETTLISGDYCGKFTSAAYPAGDDKSNLDEAFESEWYYELLKDGSYLKDALAPVQDINEPVIVYRIYDCATTYDTAANDTFVTAEGSFTLEKGAEAEVFGNDRSYGRNGLKITFGFMVNNRGVNSGFDRYIVVRGGDINNLNLRGYYMDRSKNWERVETDEITYNVERYETSYGEILPKLIMSEVMHNENMRHVKYAYEQGALTEKAICDAALKYMQKYGMLSGRPIERYEWGAGFEEVSDAVCAERIMYAAFDVTIPAGGSVTVSAEQKRYADMDISYSDDGRVNSYGIELFTSVGSTLDLISQTVTAEGMEDTRITEQNVGFDAESGLFSRETDLSEHMYYVRFVP